MKLQTPYYLLDENKLLANMLVIDKINKLSDDAVKLGIEYFSFGHKTPNEYRQIEWK